MAVLSREEYFTRLHEHLGTDSSDESIAFLEDMTDTYNDMESRKNNDGEDWEQKYHDLDKAWQKRYANRFFNGGDGCVPGTETGNTGDEHDDYNPGDVQVADLFS